MRCITSSGGYQFFTPTAVETNKKHADFDALAIPEVGHDLVTEKPKEFDDKLRGVLNGPVKK